MTTITAKCIRASAPVQWPSKVLYTMLWHYPKWIHAEGRTHRQESIGEPEWFPTLEERSAANMNPGLAIAYDIAEEKMRNRGVEYRTPSILDDRNLSRNASSSRATPVKKVIAALRADPAIPLFWGSNIPGMQAGAECNTLIEFCRRGSGQILMMTREEAWLDEMENAIRKAEAYEQAGYAKQIINRLLEPYMHITVVASGTEWSNFHALRIHPAAEPHIKMLAEANKAAQQAATVQYLEPGQWHLPFCDDSTSEDDRSFSVACCASTSYKTVDDFEMTRERASAIYSKLVQSDVLHASPFEHVATPDENIGNEIEGDVWKHRKEWGNFQGFRQFRKMLPGECQ